MMGHSLTHGKGRLPLVRTDKCDIYLVVPSPLLYVLHYLQNLSVLASHTTFHPTCNLCCLTKVAEHRPPCVYQFPACGLRVAATVTESLSRHDGSPVARLVLVQNGGSDMLVQSSWIRMIRVRGFGREE